MEKYILMWVNESDGGNLPGTFHSIGDAMKAAASAFANGDVDEDDIIQAWRVDDDGNVISTMALEEWVASDFA